MPTTETQTIPILNLPHSTTKNRGNSKQKLSKTEKIKKYQVSRARKVLKRKQRKKLKGKKEKLILKALRREFVVLQAPDNFSFINNTENVLAYFKEAYKNFSRRLRVDFNLKNISDLTPDAIALMIAKVKDRNFTRGLDTRGSKPDKQALKRIFEESGFLDHVKSAYRPPKNDGNLMIHQISSKKVHPELAKQASERAVKHTFKDKRKFQPIYKAIIECMANTDNHASTKREGVYDWWLFTYCNPENNVTSFTFLDLGIGIFNSNPMNKYKANILRGISSATGLDLTGRDNINLVPKLFSGDIYTSRTENKKRGQGLPTIKECSENSHIKNFTIVTNNVTILLPSLGSKFLTNKFNGTLLYWELHP